MKRVLQRLDFTRRKLHATISTLTPEVYSRRPAENEWSVAEVVHHIRLVEDRVLKELEAALKRASGRVSILRRLIPTSITSSRLIRVKSPKAVTPFNPPAREVELKNLDHTRDRLKEFCTTHGTKRLRNVIFTHPFLGKLDGVATVSFLSYHELRHFKQIQEVLRKLAADPRR